MDTTLRVNDPEPQVVWKGDLPLLTSNQVVRVAFAGLYLVQYVEIRVYRHKKTKPEQIVDVEELKDAD